MTNSPTIIIVEDDWSVRTLLSKYLRAQGYKIHVAEDGIEGLRLIKSILPDLLIVDYRLPGMNGLTIVKMLRSDISVKNIPVIMLTVLDRKSIINKAAELGIFAFIIKPFRIRQLLDTVKSVFAKEG
ncbi:response regulator [bacterium]|nr:response regulator [bacterium]